MSTNVVFTNGCFDILHRGHIELLKYCSTLGDKVVVGLNSDDSVKRLKGPSRPHNNEEDRRLLLLALECVDEVIIFEDDTPLALIDTIKPDLIVKGGDYKPEDIVGAANYPVQIYPFVEGYSTSSTLEKLG